MSDDPMTNHDSSRFDDIRPYSEQEAREAMVRIADSESFPLLASYVFPHHDIEEMRAMVRALGSIDEFQREVMRPFNEQVIRRSITRYSCDGLEQLDTDTPYLFISNHRDIVMDSSLLQYSLLTSGFNTSQITFGANLMSPQLVVDIGKSNKMFKVERPGGNLMKFYNSSRHLSDYIRHTITVGRESIWIAQRNGRTKDGDDRTEPSLLKMLCMSLPGDRVEALSELNIVPVVISYEWEPCDILKTLERYQSCYAAYTKRPGEDLNSILEGITAHKGEVHIEVCPPLREEELKSLHDQPNSEFFQSVSAIIDKRVHQCYRLYANNYIAHDMLYGNSDYSSHYTHEQKRDFVSRVNSLNQFAETCDIDQLVDIMLRIYATPVDNLYR